ncbi:hypothetical protein E1292_18050 [Nonomuraea deserti]|uniref:Htaa domain-containing protein n=1 Tax=Nonomuraea deserti TaxID=1848322 RepID=A0A4R4VH47_9ACTN|nr:hypothetical protein [Nonomuraea deserti]TDD04969.1 hypothetical protein E1292_18050 [Nonomuraea deserti]
MTRSLLLVSLAAGSLTAGSLTAPAPAISAATELAIRSITVRPAEPVVGPKGSVRLVIDVVARGTRGKHGVAVKVEPGSPPAPALSSKTPALDKPTATPTPSRSPSPKVSAAPRLATGGEPAADLPPMMAWRVGSPATQAAAAEGWETWRFLPDKRLNRYYPTGTWTIAATATGPGGATVTEYESFQFRRDTKLASVRVDGTAGGKVRLRGSLTRVDPRGLTDYGPFAKQTLEVLWRADESSAWERIGEVRTDAAGSFATTVSGRTGGFWRVRYPGTGHYAADVSKSRQIAQ